jgi:hypothetical protein
LLFPIDFNKIRRRRNPLYSFLSWRLHELLRLEKALQEPHPPWSFTGVTIPVSPVETRLDFEQVFGDWVGWTRPWVNAFISSSNHIGKLVDSQSISHQTLVCIFCVLQNALVSSGRFVFRMVPPWRWRSFLRTASKYQWL